MNSLRLLHSCSGLIRVAAIALVLALAGCGRTVELFANMNESEANEVLAALSEANIATQKVPGKDGTVVVTVDQSNIAHAIEVLNTQGLPHERRATMGDVFRKEGLISSPLEERARYLWALSQELSETISQIDGVLRARVHVVLPERSTGGEPPLPSSAGVFVKYRRDVNLEDAVPQIKRLVASSIPGLSVDKVSVVLVASAAGALPVPASAGAALASRSRTGTSPSQVLAYALTALSLICVAGIGGSRMLAKRQRRRGTGNTEQGIA
jgi:type III secretion protein J